MDKSHDVIGVNNPLQWDDPDAVWVSGVQSAAFDWIGWFKAWGFEQLKGGLPPAIRWGNLMRTTLGTKNGSCAVLVR